MKQIKPAGLEPRQLQLLDLVNDSPLTNSFYLTGGTALSAFYLHHRRSEDLDFFCEEEFDHSLVTTFFKSKKSEIGYDSLDIQARFNRFLVFIKYADQNLLKTEFTYYPFPRIDTANLYQKLAIDSLMDIATNKLFTIAQQPRSRDYLDLYFILNKETFTILDLYWKAKHKFDWHIDPLQLTSRFTEVDDSDFGMLQEPVNLATIKSFFEQQIVTFKEQIITK